MKGQFLGLSLKTLHHGLSVSARNHPSPGPSPSLPAVPMEGAQEARKGAGTGWWRL